MKITVGKDIIEITKDITRYIMGYHGNNQDSYLSRILSFNTYEVGLGMTIPHNTVSM